MSSILQQARNTSSNDVMFADINRLWGEPSYVNFQNRIRLQSKWNAWGLWIFCAGIKMAPTRVLCIFVAILLHPHLRSFDSDAAILFYGPSKNNDRVLRRVADILGGTCGHEAFGSQTAPLFLRLQAAMQWGQLVAMSRALSPYRRTETLLALQLMFTAAARVYFEHYLRQCRARAVILANDRSPMQVGLRAAAAQCNLKCVYCQHAPISPLYPPLKFDLSLLSDQASLAAYQRIGTVEGDVTFLPVFQYKASPISKVQTMATVGVCLSRVWANDRIVCRLRELCAHRDVKEIFLRTHPEHKVSLDHLVALDPRIKLAQHDDIISFAQKCELVVVPGSGVLIELLHSGAPCIYAGDLDLLGHDPHGFVAAGLVSDWTGRSLVNLSKEVNSFFDADWCRAFTDYDPTTNMDPDMLDDRVRVALRKTLA